MTFNFSLLLILFCSIALFSCKKQIQEEDEIIATRGPIITAPDTNSLSHLNSLNREIRVLGSISNKCDYVFKYNDDDYIISHKAENCDRHEQNTVTIKYNSNTKTILSRHFEAGPEGGGGFWDHYEFKLAFPVLTSLRTHDISTSPDERRYILNGDMNVLFELNKTMIP